MSLMRLLHRASPPGACATGAAPLIRRDDCDTGVTAADDVAHEMPMMRLRRLPTLPFRRDAFQCAEVSASTRQPAPGNKLGFRSPLANSLPSVSRAEIYAGAAKHAACDDDSRRCHAESPAPSISVYKFYASQGRCHDSGTAAAHRCLCSGLRFAFGADADGIGPAAARLR